MQPIADFFALEVRDESSVAVVLYILCFEGNKPSSRVMPKRTLYDKPEGSIKSESLLHGTSAYCP